ncbi:murein biosynthesis integral membrane protein MurJ [Janibacter limosus]|uniref:murein biosynthesis integral membrane protein MurJ n=1 Tax=Janibacter limosus TaxID=53458 RepID=UPI000A002FA5|nr:murein biosynthesis integral membrane protein MurJ [Janibacter limosus]
MSHAPAGSDDVEPAPGRQAPSIVRSSAVMAAGSLASRVLGLVRNTLTIAVVGLNLVPADAWNAANTLPNIFHLLIAGGVLNAVIVPQITKAMRHEDGGTVYINRLLTLAVTALAAVTLVLTLAAPLLVQVVVSSSWDGPSRGLATAFAVICLPQVFFYGVYTLFGQVLTAHNRFGMFMWAPALANVVAIAGLGWFLLTDAPLRSPVSDWTPMMIAVLAGSATLSIALQALVLIPSLRATGLRFRPVWGVRGSGLGSASRMAMWAFAAVAFGQLGYFVNSRVLTSATYEAQRIGVEGAGLTAYANAYLLFMLPHGLVTVSLVTALFTRLSHAAHDGDTRAVAGDLRRGMTMPAVVLIPATAISVLLAPFVLAAILPGTPRAATDASVGVLVTMMLGLVPYGWFFLVQRAYYAYEDGRTPFVLQVLVTLVAVTFTLIGSTRAPQDVATWVGIGQSLSNLTAAVLGLWLLQRRLGTLRLGRVVRQNTRLLLATLLATGLGWLVLDGLGRVVDTQTWFGAVIVTAFVALVVLAASLAIAARMRVREVTEMLAPLTRRLGRG